MAIQKQLSGNAITYDYELGIKKERYKRAKTNEIKIGRQNVVREGVRRAEQGREFLETTRYRNDFTKPG